MNKSLLLIVLPLFANLLIQSLYWKQDIFKSEKKLFLQPPSYVFGIVWTSIYIMLGIFLYRIVNSSETYHRWILVIFTINLLLNYIWTPLVMVYGKKKLGVFVIALMIGTILSLMLSTEDVLCRNLLVPYITWLIVALQLNIELLRKTVKFAV